MNVYFFSNYIPDPQMIEDLGESIQEQFKGHISNIYARGDEIVFTETLHLGGQTITICPAIPKQSIVVVESPPLLQGDWLEAGVHTLLVPQFRQGLNGKGCHTFTYCGLIQVHKIHIETSPWLNQESNKTVLSEQHCVHFR